jgi:hypothetical protein
MRLLGFITTSVAAAALLTAVGVGAAVAAGDLCTSLEAQLAGIDRGPGDLGGNDPRQYDNALNKQRIELDRATTEARRASCMGGFLLFRGNPEPKCGALMATIARMKANLDRLSAAQNRAAGNPYMLSQRRGQLLRALADNQCGDQYAGYGSFGTQRRPGGFFATLFGQSRVPDQQGGWGQDGYYYGNAPTVGTYRTLCVRTCDGYYFPISFSTVSSQFAADEQTCQSMCPGAAVALYTHRNPGEESESMVSLGGEPYANLPTAFKYRQQYDATCACHPAATTALAEFGLTGTVAPTNATPVNPEIYASLIPVPQPRPSASEDPETLADRTGDFVPKPVGKAPSSPVANLVISNGRRVRVVGPSYYIAQ